MTSPLLLVRWEGRPKTPPFRWGAAGEVVPPHDQWLKDFDCSFWGLDKLVEPALLQQNPNFLERDLKETKDVFLQWAGALQAVFTIYQLQVGCFLTRWLGMRINLDPDQALGQVREPALHCCQARSNTSK